jgi:hypothetical protein
MPLLDTGRVERLCSRQCSPLSALEAAVGLGCLAAWWLRPEVLHEAARLQPEWAPCWAGPVLSPELGGCHLLLVSRDPERLKLLRPAFLLPVCWVTGEGHAPGLPAALRPLAEKVVSQVVESRARESGGTVSWGLRLAFGAGQEELDLTGLEMDFGSAWAPLAAGLLLAGQGIVADPEVWATGTWDRYSGVGPVEGLPAKLELAREHGVRRLFLPLPQRREAEQIGPGDPSAPPPQLGFLLPDERGRPREVLRPLLTELGMPPDENASLETRGRNFALLPGDHPRAYPYYRETILPEVVVRLRRLREERWPDWRPSHLVTILSTSEELVPLAAGALAVRHVLICYTPDGEKGRLSLAAGRIRADLEARGVACTLAPFRDGSPLEIEASLHPHVQAFTAGIDPKNAVLDVTPGKKPMALALERLAPPDSWLVYWKHEQLGDRRPDPGHEDIERWPARGGL